MQRDVSDPVLKRLIQEYRALCRNPPHAFLLYPVEGNMLQWHFTLQGPEDSPYAIGLYHGKVFIPPTYPISPPDIVLLTPNGRFEHNQRIGVSILAHHTGSWRPSYTLTILLFAFREFLKLPSRAEAGSLESSIEEREKLAKESQAFFCPSCSQRVSSHYHTLMTRAHRRRTTPRKAKQTLYFYPIRSRSKEFVPSPHYESDDTLSSTTSMPRSPSNRTEKRRAHDRSQTVNQPLMRNRNYESDLAHTGDNSSKEKLRASPRATRPFSRNVMYTKEETKAYVSALPSDEVQARHTTSLFVLNTQILDRLIFIVFVGVVTILWQKWRNNTLHEIVEFLPW